MPDVAVFTKAGAHKVAEATRRVLALPKNDAAVPMRPRAGGGGPGMRYAKLTAALSAPATFLSTPTTANAVFMVQDGTTGNLKVGATFVVKNRWPALTLASGKYLIVGRVAGEWAIIASECP